ncbi:amidohydrolase family protein [Thermoactinospora rubra]|uniref:amidohydrolase family protein n=1 Tax=Thermoactinospora rubra TaxID=1088767 RepID=UPI000A105171|nr:amidohydrolase family protein [Thermoactinospora rubra]
MIVDAHHHLWRGDYPWLAEPGLEPIRRDYTVADLRRVLDGSGVRATVLVEGGLCAAEETAGFLATAAATPEIAGVVGWVSLADPDIAATLERYRSLPGGELLVGLRDQVQGVADPAFLARADVRANLAAIGAAGLACDLVVRAHQLPACAAAAAATPGTAFVLDHLGKPRIDAGGLAEWRELVAPLAACPNVSAKLSGLLTEAGPGWTGEAVRPFVEEALELFGPERLMIGSDWPVCELVASYRQALEVMGECLAGVSGDERARIHAGTAIDVYGLKLRAP